MMANLRERFEVCRKYIFDLILMSDKMSMNSVSSHISIAMIIQYFLCNKALSGGISF